MSDETIIPQKQSPEAVIANELVKDFIDSGLHPLENNKLYVYLEKLPEEKLKSMLRRFEKKWYSPGEDSKQIETSIGKKFLPCLFHPGVAIRLDDFIKHIQEIAKGSGVEKMTSLDAIKSFSTFLGTIDVYRGMAIQPQESRVFKEKGILADSIQKDAFAIAALLNPDLPERKVTDTKGLPRSFSDDAKSRTTGFGDINTSVSVSVSGYPEVASSVGWHSSSRKNEQGVTPVLFSLKIPRISCYSAEEIFNDYRGPDAVMVGDKRFTRQNLELFVPFGLSSKWITNMEERPAPPQWTRAR